MPRGFKGLRLLLPSDVGGRFVFSELNMVRISSLIHIVVQSSMYDIWKTPSKKLTATASILEKSAARLNPGTITRAG